MTDQPPRLRRKRQLSMTPDAIRQRESRSLRKPGGGVVSIPIQGHDVDAIERAASSERLVKEYPAAAAVLAAICVALLPDE